MLNVYPGTHMHEFLYRIYWEVKLMSHENPILLKKYQSISKMVVATYVPTSSQFNCYFKQDTFII